VTRAIFITAVLGLFPLAAVPGAQRPQPAPAAGDLVELDVIALDRRDQPVTDLRLEDFQVAEDGRVMSVKTFSKVTALGSAQPDDGRVVTLLMDDIGVGMTGTSPMQSIAPVLLSPSGQGDEVSVVRLSSRSDEAFGDVMTARERIAGYRGGTLPASSPDTPEAMLRAVAKISRQLELIDHRRKVILCLGLPSVCDVAEPALGGTSVLWSSWVAAITAAARANVSVYCVDPRGVRGGMRVSGSGLVRLTGGESLATNDFAMAAGAIWREAGHYYQLGYWSGAANRDLHSIGVHVARRGVHVRARQRR
jgi:VWFA-related protein